MPDHVHLVMMGQSDDSDFEGFMRSWSTQTGFAWRRRYRSALWQGGYYERVMRGDAHLYLAACYVVMNPVRAGMVDDAKEYEFTGSTTHPLEHFLHEG